MPLPPDIVRTTPAGPVTKSEPAPTAVCPTCQLEQVIREDEPFLDALGTLFVRSVGVQCGHVVEFRVLV